MKTDLFEAEHDSCNIMRPNELLKRIKETDLRRALHIGEQKYQELFTVNE
jgi:hypothetical protein